MKLDPYVLWKISPFTRASGILFRIRLMAVESKSGQMAQDTMELGIKDIIMGMEE